MSKSSVYEPDARTAVDLDEGQLVVFKLNDVEFGVDINNVREIVRLPEVTPIPRCPDYISGVCNLRGVVLPVIDTRIRFSMESGDVTEDTRLLVVESQGMNAGLVVDDMREVMRLNDVLVEVPPAICKGIEKEFLENVVKVDGGKRLILTLNLAEVIKVETLTEEKIHVENKAGKEECEDRKKAVEEEQLVSFLVAGEEYAFEIEKVREILRVDEITPVPNVPDYVKGLFTIRNRLIPVVDLRSLLGARSLIEERKETIHAIAEEHRKWLAELKYSLESGTEFTGITNPKECLYGRWLEHYNTSSTDIQAVLKKIKKQHALVHVSAPEAIELLGESKDKALEYYEKVICPLMESVLSSFEELKESIERNINEDQRVLVVKAGSIRIGFLVDSVNEVVRIERAIIDEAPAIASTKDRELKGIAKLDRGERLIMIMDETGLISRENAELIKQAASSKKFNSNNENREPSPSEQNIDEEQLVTFSINNEEYGIRVADVQEINRLGDVMRVPRAPSFIDGVTNLRGNVIPVLNVRKLFGMVDKASDDRTRIIIVELGGSKTGLRVDEINEVLRVMKDNIGDAPSIVASGVDNKFISGVCRLDDGKRLIILLDIGKILNKEALDSLVCMDMQSRNEKKEGIGTKKDAKKRKAKKGSSARIRGTAKNGDLN